jgi:hypothetical protein
MKAHATAIVCVVACDCVCHVDGSSGEEGTEVDSWIHGGGV